MAWIKYDTSLHKKPKVRRIADATGLDPFGAAARLCAVWAWADTMTEDGRIEHANLADIDHEAQVQGFAQAMLGVGWLVVDGDDIVIPGWDQHHSASAKKRSQTAKRVAKVRKKSVSKTVGNASALHVSNAQSQARGEEIRKEKTVDAYASTPDPGECVPFAGATKNAHQFADELLSSVKWNPQRRGGDTGNRLLAKALVRLRDGARGQEASEDPGGWIGDRMVEYLESLSGPGFHPKFRGWIEEQYPDLVSEGEPLDAHR